jgi:hypothetical protein
MSIARLRERKLRQRDNMLQRRRYAQSDGGKPNRHDQSMTQYPKVQRKTTRK